MTARAPYPGLRPFRRTETDLFFGREGNIDEIIDRLAATRFVAVLGASGSGKSSLVKTGLLEALELGQLHQAGTAWRIAEFRPGDNPIANLARALLRPSSEASAPEDSTLEIDMLAAFLRRGPRAVVEWCADGHLAPNANLLLLVDQFEELFRYDSYATREQAQAFVNLLIESARQRDLPIYVVLTMRSEYLGACSLIDGLAEAINRGQYLTTRMTREQCRRAIVGPAQVCEIEIEPALVNRLLNDLAAFAPWEEDTAGRGEVSPGTEARSGTSQLDRLARRADQLPLMSHVLNRLWGQSRDRGDTPPRLALADYAPAGLRGALSAHAEDVLKELVARHGDRIAGVAEKIFRALVSGASVADAVRRPTAIAELVKLAGDDRDAVLAVVEAFRASDCSFLLPESTTALTDSTQVDISHESLIRQWDRLSGWVESEGAAGTWWRHLVDDALAWKRLVDDESPKADESLLRGVELTQALDLRAAYRPTPAWSERYGGNFDSVERFLERSSEAQSDSESEQKRRRWIRYGAVAMVILAIGAGIWAKIKDDEVTTAEAQSGERAFGAIVTRAIGSQEQGDWQTAGALLGSLLDGIVVDRKGEPALPPLPGVQNDKLDWALRRQFANLWATRIDDHGSARRGIDFYGNVRRRIAAIAVRYDDRIETNWAQPNGQWYAGVTINKLKNDAKQTRFPMAFYDYANAIAVIEGEELVLHRIGLGDANPVRRLKIDLDDTPREKAAGSDQSGEIPRLGSQRATVFTRMVACDAARTAFIAWDDTHAVWQINVVNDRAVSRKLLSGNANQNWTVEPDGNRYGLTLRNETPKKVYVGECDRLEDPQPVPMTVGADIRDIEFTSRNLLAVVDSAKDARFFEADAEGKWRQKSAAARYPAEATFVAFADDRRLWLSYARYYNANGLRHAGTELKLWDAEAKAVQGSLVPTTTRSDSPLVIGRTHWVLWDDAGKPLVVQRAMPSSSSIERLGAMSSAVGSGSLDLYDDDDDSSGKYIREAWKRFGHDDPNGRSNMPTRREAPDCSFVLERIANALELRSVDGNTASSGARRLAVSQIIPLEPFACTEAGDAGEKALLSKLATTRADLLDTIEFLSNGTQTLTDSYRSQLVSMALRGSSGSLRMLAADFHLRTQALAAQALDRQIVLMGLAPSYRLVEAATRDATLIDVIVQRKNPVDGRDREIQARSVGGTNKSEALLQLAMAQRHYERMGDSFSAKRIAALRDELAKTSSEEDLLSLWRALAARQLPSPLAASATRPKPAPPSDGAATLAEALEMLARRVDEPKGRAEILMASMKASPAQDRAGAVRRLRLAWEAVESEPNAPGFASLTDLTCELAEAAEKSEMRPEMQKAAAACLIGRSQTLRAGDDNGAPAMTDALKRAVRVKVMEAPGLLARMNWNFTHLKWGGFNNGDISKQRSLLVAALDLQDALTANGAGRSADLLFAMADTSFWLGRFNPSKPAEQQQFTSRAVQLFEEIDRTVKEQQTADMRLQRAETLLSKATDLSADKEASYRQLIAVYEDAKNHYEELSKSIDQLANGDYLRVAVVSGLSIAYTDLAAYLGNTALAAWVDGSTLVAERDAREALRYSYRQAALFAPTRHRDIGEAQSLYVDGKGGERKNKESFCCLEPASQGTEAWMVGMAAGQQATNRKDSSAPTKCEQLAASVMDPQRRVRGNLRITSDKAAAEACMHELERNGKTAADDFLLARLYKALAVPRDDVIRMFVSAANAEYAIAYYHLSNELTDCKQIAAALLDRYRYLVVRRYLRDAWPRLFPASGGGDQAAESGHIADWLDGLARTEPDSSKILPKLGSRLEFTFLMQQCAK